MSSTPWDSFDCILKTTGQEEIYWIKQNNVDKLQHFIVFFGSIMSIMLIYLSIDTTNSSVGNLVEKLENFIVFSLLLC